MKRGGSRSNLSLQLGQETIYLIMTIAVATAIFLALLVTRHIKPEKEPPIIVMRQTQGLSFATGSAILGQAFKAKLRKEILPHLRDARSRYEEAFDAPALLAGDDDIVVSPDFAVPSGWNDGFAALFGDQITEAVGVAGASVRRADRHADPCVRGAAVHRHGL